MQARIAELEAENSLGTKEHLKYRRQVAGRMRELSELTASLKREQSQLAEATAEAVQRAEAQARRETKEVIKESENFADRFRKQAMQKGTDLAVAKREHQTVENE